MSDLYAIEAAIDADDPDRAVALLTEYSNLQEQRGHVLRARLYERYPSTRAKLCGAIVRNALKSYTAVRSKADEYVAKELNTPGSVPHRDLRRVCDVLEIAVAGSKKFMEIYDHLIAYDGYKPAKTIQEARKEATGVFFDLQKQLAQINAVYTDTK